MNINGKIYKITNKVNGKVYIGQTIQGIVKRWWGHWSEHCRECPKLKNAIRKHGKENFSIDIIDRANNFEDLNTKEEYWISFFNSTELGYNLHKGGNNRQHTLEFIIKMKKNNTRKKEIIRVSLTDGSVKEYDKIFDVKKDGFCRSNVSLCLNGKKDKYLNHVWKFKSEIDNLEDYIYIILQTVNPLNHLSMHKPVIGISITDNSVIRLNKLTDAIENGLSRNQISLCARGLRSKYRGYIWSFT